MSSFFYVHSVLYPFGELPAIYIKDEIVSANSLNFEESKICRLGKG